MKKKVLLTGMGNNLGGTESFVHTVIEHLTENCEFSILSIVPIEDVAYLEFLKRNNIQIFYLNNIFGIKNVLKRKKIIEVFLKKNKFDIIHINATTLNTTYMAKAAAELGIKVIYQVHNLKPSGYSSLAKLLTKVIKLKNIWDLYWIKNITLVSVSEDVAHQVFAPLKSKVILNGVTTKEFKFDVKERNIVRKNLNIKESDKVGIIVARMVPIKNYSKVISIINEGLENDFDKFLIVGDGSERDKINDAIQNSKYSNSIYVLGERTDINRLLWASDFMLLTSIAEGLSISVIEAQAAGVVPIVSKGVPSDTNITGKVTYIDINEADDVWLKSIRKVLDENIDREYMNTLVNDSQFSVDYFIKEISEIYKL
ncbi:glycosyltransferase [Latilactobacillus sakei]|uniref:glycosyltransferase n=1 Tax=Latilactobacillus sakei TaxID=1599 RepID=UPI000C1287AA|nr:glycosyltransferase [Latilactobacillus sakei]SON73810.1 putative Group 1 glycosyltransferase [Latilactobacillus sakei]